MKRHFNTHIEGLDLQFWHDLIESRGKLVSLKKGEYLCRKGESTNICGYVKSGYFKYTVDGTNKIGGFAFPDALLGDYPSCMDNVPAMFDIVAGQKSEVWVMDATILPKLFEDDVEVGKQGRLFMQAAYVSLAKRYYALYAKTPMERYVDLIHEHPQIEQDVPQKEIAEYLQIKPYSLSLTDRLVCLIFRLNHCKNQMRLTLILLLSITPEIRSKEVYSNNILTLYDSMKQSVFSIFLCVILVACSSVHRVGKLSSSEIIGYASNGYIMDKNKEIIGYYRNGYTLDTNNRVTGTYGNGYIFNTNDSIIALYSNGYILNYLTTRPSINP